ncbi:MAG: hypothetical protein JXX14_24280 [Deltaproteobacteria bacterium]|nr:hypothetical protein [Deltaproteobacteria bacterium]
MSKIKSTRKQNRHPFELQSHEKWNDKSIVVDVDNSGDEDNLIYGCLTLDDRDRLLGWGVSDAWEEELSITGGWDSLVDSFERFDALRHQEQLLEQAENRLAKMEERIQMTQHKLDSLRTEARLLKREYGSLPSDTVMTGLQTAAELDRLKAELKRQLQYLETVRSKLVAIENSDAPDPDEVPADDGGYNTIHYHGVINWGQSFIVRLRRLMGTLCAAELERQLKLVKTKRDRKEMVFCHFVEASGLIFSELYSLTGQPKYQRGRNQMAAMWRKYALGSRLTNAALPEPREVLFDPSERQYADMGLGDNELVHAIDIRAWARKLSTRHNVTFEEAIEMAIAD